MKECTIYIEEISNSDNDDDVNNNEYKNDDVNDEEINDGFLSIKNDTTTIQSCPVLIGGGSTITCIQQKLFVIGGCNRTGDPPSSAVHYYDFGKKKDFVFF